MIMEVSESATSTVHATVDAIRIFKMAQKVNLSTTSILHQQFLSFSEVNATTSKTLEKAASAPLLEWSTRRAVLRFLEALRGPQSLFVAGRTTPAAYYTGKESPVKSALIMSETYI